MKISLIRLILRFAAVILLLGFLAACAGKTTRDLPFLGTNKASDDLRIQVTGPENLKEDLETELAKQRKSNKKLQQTEQSAKLVRLERTLLDKKLRSEGYYAATIDLKRENGTRLYIIDAGPRYTIETAVVLLPEAIDRDIDAASLGIKQGAPLLATDVIEAKKTLRRELNNSSCLYEINVTHRVVVYHPSQQAQVELRVDDSPQVRIGDIHFKGLETVQEQYLRDILTISPGECFVRQRIDQARLKLFQTDLLSSITPRISEPLDGAVDITFDIIERSHRTVTAGVVYQTDDGGGVALGWEHRNLMGRAQRFKIDSLWAERRQELTSSLTLPRFKRSDQSLRLFSSIENQETKAFESKVGGFGAEISRKLKPHLTGFVSLEFDFSRILEQGNEEDFALISSPLALEYDRRNDLLDPKGGWVISGRTAPYWDAYNSSTYFFKSTFAASYYISRLTLPAKPTLALRTAMGSITGVDRDEVPANIRYYVGGGGSVRGYPFQTLGPLEDEEPRGGMSFTELSMEARLRFTESWGAALFIDGGYAYENEMPQFGEDLRYGWGLGLRYFTNFAPIRVDVAFPMNRREEIDDSFQLYISIGQSF